VKLIFLGTGTSFGVPVIGCTCETCTSEDWRDRRTRHGAIIAFDGKRLLVDTPPELRQQLLAAHVSQVDAVWYTHTHADHIHGIDDLRIFTTRSGRDLTAFVPRGSAVHFHRRFPYVFDPAVLPPEGTTKPRVRLVEVSPGESIEVLGRTVHPLPVPHGTMTVFGLRIGRLGYVTDAKRLPEPVLDSLRGVRVLVLNALWFGRPHPTHFNVEEAVAAAERVGAERTFLTHLTHRARHEELMRRLPQGVEPAHDGLIVEIADD
jgi:phosphoribosyl 1,2-cyclic phosphate phosphodiesterase